MAEFCLDCWNRMNGTHYTEREIILTRGLELCEGCGQWKRTTVVLRRHPLFYDLKRLFLKEK